MKLHEIAHCRSGDKGDYTTLAIIAFNQKDYAKIEKYITAEAVKDYYSELVKGGVKRYELPKLGMFVFELEHALGGGVTRTLRLDIHGKNNSFGVLEMTLPDD
jgi:hypothetical protein